MSDGDQQALVQEFRFNMRQAERSMRRFEGKMDRHLNTLNRSADRGLKTMESRFAVFSDRAGTALAALAAGAGLQRSIAVMADFSQAMSTVAAITQATGSDFAALEAQARLLGSTTRFSATQAAEGMLYLARAGFDTDQVLGSIEGTLQLAQAGALDLGRAADIASNILSGFRLDISETARVVDVLALAANSANTDVDQLGEAMKFVAPVAAGMGVSLEEATAAIAALSNNGLQASLAGTGLRRVLSELESPSSKTRGILSELGVTVDQVRPSINNLTDVIALLADRGLTTAQALEVFGDRGGPAFEVLSNSIPSIREMNSALGDAGGTARRIATVMDDNLNGAILATISRIQELILAMGDAGAETALIASLEGIQGLLTLMAENADVLQVALIALAARAVVPLAVSLGRDVALAAQRAIVQLSLLNAIAGRSTTAMQVMSITARGLWSALGPLTIAIAAISAGYIALARSGTDAQTALSNVQQTLRNYASTQEAIATDTRELETLQNNLTEAMEAQADAAELTARTEIDRVQERIAANRELLELYQLQARAQLAEAEGALADLEIPRELRELRTYTNNEGRSFTTRPNVLASDDELARIRDEVTARQDAGQMREGDSEILDYLAERARLQREIISNREQIDALGGGGGNGVFGRVGSFVDNVRDHLPDGERRGSGAGNTSDQLAALEEIERAYQDVTQTELQQIEAVRAARLAAIDEQLAAAEISADRANQLRAQVAGIAKVEIEEVRAAEAEAAAQAEEERARMVEGELNAVQQIANSRDWLLGRTASLLDREYEMRADRITRDIADEERRNEALAALGEERARAEADLRAQVLEQGQYSEDPLERLAAQHEAELQTLKDALDMELITREEFLQRRNEMEMEADLALAEQRASNQQTILSATQSFFSALGALAKKRAGEDSALAKAMFIAEKAVAAGQVWIQAEIAKWKAMAELGPIAGPPAAAAIDVSKYLSLATIAAQTVAGFKDGVVNLRGPGTGRSDSIPANISAGESVITTRGTSLNEDLLRSVNRGERVQETMQRMRRLIDSGSVAPGALGAAGGRSVSIGQIGGDLALQVEGNLDPAAVPAVEAALAAHRADLRDQVKRAVAQFFKDETPRHKRPASYR